MSPCLSSGEGSYRSQPFSGSEKPEPPGGQRRGRAGQRTSVGRERAVPRQQSLLHGGDTAGTLVALRAEQACHPVPLGATTAAGPSRHLAWLPLPPPRSGLGLGATVAFREMMAQDCHCPPSPGKSLARLILQTHKSPGSLRLQAGSPAEPRRSLVAGVTPSREWLRSQSGCFPRRLSGKTTYPPVLRSCGFNPWVGKIPWRRQWKPTPGFLPGKFHRQRSLVGYSP